MDILSGLFGAPIPAISAQELNEKLKNAKAPLVVDVREPEEYQQGHIARAKLIPLGELGQRLKDLPKDQDFFCVCASGSRSTAATRQLVKAGYKAINMSGGMSAWMRAGLPVKKGSAA